MQHCVGPLFAPLKSGALLLVTCLLAVSCRGKGTAGMGGTLPTRDQVVAQDSANRVEEKNLACCSEKCDPPTRIAAMLVASSTDKEATAKEAGLRFVGYNLANWLVLDERYDQETKKSSKNVPKPEDEKKAVVAVVAGSKPDVLGVCEIGTKNDLIDVQTRLKAVGLDLPHLHYSGGVDPTRHLGLLSRFPIVSTAKPVETTYQIGGKDYGIQRGILDASIKTPDGRLWRFVGVHLKSKREVEEGDQSEMRIREAELLRRHLDEIFKADPAVRLIAYGDYNDTRMTKPLKIVQGPYRSPRALMPITLKDSRGEFWTHYWGREDVYSRIDYIMVSEAMRNDVIIDQCLILEAKDWKTASDHRPLLGVFR